MVSKGTPLHKWLVLKGLTGELHHREGNCANNVLSLATIVVKVVVGNVPVVAVFAVVPVVEVHVAVVVVAVTVVVVDVLVAVFVVACLVVVTCNF